MGACLPCRAAEPLVLCSLALVLVLPACPAGRGKDRANRCKYLF
jgi:hypothetical protein